MKKDWVIIVNHNKATKHNGTVRSAMLKAKKIARFARCVEIIAMDLSEAHFNGGTVWFNTKPKLMDKFYNPYSDDFDTYKVLGLKGFLEEADYDHYRKADDALRFGKDDSLKNILNGM